MSDGLLNDLIVASTAIAFALIVLYGLISSSAGRPSRQDAGPPPDWSCISDYYALAQAANAAYALAPDAFLAGPFRRFLEICSDPADNARVRARAMEFGRGVLKGYCRTLAEAGGDAAAIESRARALAADWFARPEVPDGDYMLEVLDGVSTHNYRGKREA